jgi:hypothetical protein
MQTKEQLEEKIDPHEKVKTPYRLKKGQSTFEINLITGKIEYAKYKKVKGVDDVLIERKNCVYLPALNKAHAKKLFDNITAKLKTTTMEDLKKEVEGGK